jgi:hypothetical protein
MAGRGGGDDNAVFVQRSGRQQTPRRRRRGPPPPPLSAEQYNDDQPPRFEYYPIQSPGYPVDLHRLGDVVMAGDSPLAAATTNLELTDGEAEGDGSPAAEAGPAEAGLARKRQKRNKPTLSCFECVERKTKVRSLGP